MSRARRYRFGAVAALLPLLALSCLAHAGEACYRRDTGRPDVLPGCKQTAPGTLVISAAALAALQFDENGLAALQAGAGEPTPEGLYALARTTLVKDELHYARFDRAFGQFLGQSKRSAKAGRIGYYDTQLQPAFAERFDWGFPFENGSAEVCNGCHEGPPDAGGHTGIVGGTHFRIDRQGAHLSTAR